MCDRCMFGVRFNFMPVCLCNDHLHTTHTSRNAAEAALYAQEDSIASFMSIFIPYIYSQQLDTCASRILNQDRLVASYTEFI